MYRKKVCLKQIILRSDRGEVDVGSIFLLEQIMTALEGL